MPRVDLVVETPASATGAAYAAAGQRFHTYPAHPSLIRSYDKSPHYKMLSKPGYRSNRISKTSMLASGGGRPCAVFEYTGPRATRDDSEALLS